MKVLFVCLGNICRSPLAQGILENKLRKRNLKWEVDSAGTGDWHVGDKPDARSIAVAKKYDIDITAQSARQLISNDLKYYDLIFAMDNDNLTEITKLAENTSELSKVKMILNESFPDGNKIIPDPYYNSNGFEEVFSLLDGACSKMIEHYK